MLGKVLAGLRPFEARSKWVDRMIGADEELARKTDTWLTGLNTPKVRLQGS